MGSGDVSRFETFLCSTVNWNTNWLAFKEVISQAQQAGELRSLIHSWKPTRVTPANHPAEFAILANLAMTATWSGRALASLHFRPESHEYKNGNYTIQWRRDR